MSQAPGAQLRRLMTAATKDYRPLSAMIELTHRCHLACVHCYLDDNHDWSAKSRELSTDEAKAAITQLQAAGCMFLTLSGGETFLRPDLLELLAHARRLGLAVTLFTTGTLLREDHLPALAKLYLRAVEVSLYSAEPGVHDAITQRPGSHERTLRAVHRLLAHAIPVVVKCPIMRSNLQAYPALRQLAIDLGVRLTVDPVVTTTNAGRSSPLQERLSAAQLAELYAHPELQPRHSLPAPDAAAPICAIGKRSCIVGPYGDVYTCLGYQHALGNLRQQSFAEIWRDTGRLAQLRRLTVGDLPVCGTCQKSAYCGRCAGSALAEHGAFDGPSQFACTHAAAREQAAGLPAEQSAAERLSARPPRAHRARRTLPLLQPRTSAHTRT